MLARVCNRKERWSPLGCHPGVCGYYVNGSTQRLRMGVEAAVAPHGVRREPI